MHTCVMHRVMYLPVEMPVWSPGQGLWDLPVLSAWQSLSSECSLEMHDWTEGLVVGKEFN